MENANALIQYDPRLFLFKALTKLEEQHDTPIEKMDELNSQILAIVNKRAMVKPVDISKLAELRTVARDVILRLNLGVEHSSKENLAHATHLLLHNDMIRFYQIGNTLMVKLKKEAQQIQQRSQLTVSESETYPKMMMEMFLLNHAERYFLEELQFESLLISEASTVIESEGVPLREVIDPMSGEVIENLSLGRQGKPIEQLSQVQVALQMLKNLSHRLDYLASLPLDLMKKEKDFRYAPNMGRANNLGGRISCGIMVNLAIDSGKYFCVTLGDVQQFCEQCVGPDGVAEEVEGMLLKWLIEYLGTHQATEAVVDYAYDYWMYWLEKLGAFLRQPPERRDELDNWFIL